MQERADRHPEHRDQSRQRISDNDRHSVAEVLRNAHFESEESPVVRVKGLALMGGVNVCRKGMPGETRNRIGWSK